MLKFITRFFAVIGFLVIASIATGIFAAKYMQSKAEREPDSIVLQLDFDSAIVEQNQPSPLDFVSSGGESVALLDIIRAIDRAKDDPHVKGIVARFGTEQPSLIQAQEIRAALARFQKSNKFTYAFGTDFGEFGTGNRAYFLASAFNDIWLQPVGTVSLTGVAIEDFFGKTALDKIGVTADFMQREEYKDFMERAQRDGFSPPVKIEMQAMIENLQDQIASGIAASRKMEVPQVKELMEKGPYTAVEAQQAGLVTRIAYADEFDDEIDKVAGKDSKQTDVGTYMGYAGDDKPDAKAATQVALIYGTGLITDKSIDGGSITGDEVMGADEIVGAFDDAADNKDVKAILFRIDSPGGSPAASESIRRALVHAQQQGKPVIISMGDTAASGGYWIAMNGDRIVADPATLTGSIGVLSGKFAGDGLLQKLGITVDGVRTTENAGMWQMTAPFTPAQRARVNALLDDTYHAFVSNVSTARKIPMEKMPDIAKGRVWTGEQAIGIGLVDELGGYDVALANVRKALKLGDNDMIDLEEFPAEPTPTERLMKLLRHLNGESAALSSSAKLLVKLQATLQPWLDLIALAHQPVEARMRMEKIHE